MRGVLALLVGFGVALAAAPEACAEPRKATESVRMAEALRKPMVFRLGRHADSPACGLDCAEFIVAEGEIRRDSAEALAILANRLRRPLPVIFHSPGGSLDGGLALGRALRHYRLEAKVARLTPVPCQTEDCARIDRQSGVVSYERREYAAVCNSACVYTFLGGWRRDLAAGSALGIHRFYLAHANDPRRRPLTRLSMADTAKLDRSVKDLAFYLIEMGISSELLSMASAVEPSSIRYLSAADLASLGILGDRSTGEEQPLPPPTTRIGEAIIAAAPQRWPLVERNGQPFAVFALPMESRRYGGMTSEVAIGCSGDGRTYATSFRELIGGKPGHPQDARFSLTSAAPATTGALSRELAAGAEKAGILSVDVVSSATAGYPLRIDFPAAGLISAIDALDRACARPQASLGGTGLVPRQRP